MELSGFILIYSAIVVAVTALTVGVFQWVFSSGHWSDRSVFATASKRGGVGAAGASGWFGGWFGGGCGEGSSGGGCGGGCGGCGGH